MGIVSELRSGQDSEWDRKANRLILRGGSPHFAPDANMLAIYRRRIASIQPCGTALILGATPELADIALEAGFRLIRIDSSAAMFEAAAQRRQVTGHSGEVEIIADWLDMNMIGRGEIDVVLGDASLNNVPHERMDALLDELARITRPGGDILLRQIVLPDHDVPAYEFANAMQAQRERRISLHELDRVLRFYSFRTDAMEPSRHLMDARRVFDILCAKHAAAELTDDEFAFLSDRRSEIGHTIYRMSEQAHLLARLGNCEIDMLPQSCYFRDLTAIFIIRVAQDG